MSGDAGDVGVDGAGAVESGAGESGAFGSNLERRYRALLRVLPAWYRREREDEMVGIFLSGRGDELDREHGWPGWGEAGATLALAVRVRFAADRRAGDVVRLIALAGLLGHVVVIAQGWTATAVWGREGGPEGWLVDAGVLAAFGALLSGRRAVARVVIAALCVLGLVSVPVSAVTGVPSWWLLLWQGPLLVTAAAVLSGFHREAPPAPRRWWVMALVGVAAGVVSALPVPLSWATVLGAWGITAVVVAAFRPWAVRVEAPAGP